MENDESGHEDPEEANCANGKKNQEARWSLHHPWAS